MQHNLHKPLHLLRRASKIVEKKSTNQTELSGKKESSLIFSIMSTLVSTLWERHPYVCNLVVFHFIFIVLLWSELLVSAGILQQRQVYFSINNSSETVPLFFLLMTDDLRELTGRNLAAVREGEVSRGKFHSCTFYLVPEWVHTEAQRASLLFL